MRMGGVFRLPMPEDEHAVVLPTGSAATLVLVGFAAWEARLRHRRRAPQLVRTGVQQG